MPVMVRSDLSRRPESDWTRILRPMRLRPQGITSAMPLPTMKRSQSGSDSMWNIHACSVLCGS